MNRNIRLQLSFMMFLEFFIWGCWFVTMGNYLPTVLNATGLQIGAAYATNAIGAIIAPFFVGMFADKYFAAQKILGAVSYTHLDVYKRQPKKITNGPPRSGMK